jgi:hypothetical protein
MLRMTRTGAGGRSTLLPYKSWGGGENFLQGFAENGAEFWRCFAGDDIFAKTKKDAMIASLHVKL